MRSNERFDQATRLTMSLLLSSLYKASALGGYIWVSYVSRREWYSQNREWLGPSITCATVTRCVTLLLEGGFVEFRPGRSSQSVSFRIPNAIRSNQKLDALIKSEDVDLLDVSSNPDFQPIRLRQSKRDGGKFVGFDDTPETLRMRKNLRIINTALWSQWPDLQITNEEMKTLAAGRDANDDDQEGEQRPTVIDLSKRTVYRVFNNAKSDRGNERFDEGGRFYGPWWQAVPRELRPFITINGKRTVEVDYSAMHPTILYHQVGKQPPANPYDIGIGSRALVKKTVNALLNAKGLDLRAVPGFSEVEIGIEWSVFLSQVRCHFAHFEHLFGTGIGLKLQRLDSDIAEAVMLEFAPKEVMILPVHDSFICHYAMEQELRDAMERHFFRIVGAPIKLKKMELEIGQQRAIVQVSSESHTALVSGGMSEIEALLSGDYAYSDYFERQDQWFARRPELIAEYAVGPNEPE